jgi:magnesium and cobalt transporter
MTDSDKPPPRRRSIWTRMRYWITPEPQVPDNIKQLQRLISRSEHAFLEADTSRMIDGVLEIAQMQVRDIMIPRSQMVTLDKYATYDAHLKVLADSAHSRFPVVQDTADNVVGILLAKDLLHWCADGHSHEEFVIDEVLRPVIFVPESKRLNVILREFRNKRIHMAVVVDEYGGTSGLITLEDVLEQIVGDISDEHDTEEDEHDILRHSQVRHTVKAQTSLEAFNDYFDVAVEHPDVDTIGGLVIQRLGHMPKRGDIVDIDGAFRIKVLRADKRRVYLLQVNLLNENMQQ